jgi:hypothetical protein
LTDGNRRVLWKHYTTDNEVFQLIVEQSPSTPAGIRINRFDNRADEANFNGIVDGFTLSQSSANDEAQSYTDGRHLAGATASTTAYYGMRVC